MTSKIQQLHCYCFRYLLSLLSDFPLDGNGDKKLLNSERILNYANIVNILVTYGCMDVWISVGVWKDVCRYTTSLRRSETFCSSLHIYQFDFFPFINRCESGRKITSIAFAVSNDDNKIALQLRNTSIQLANIQQTVANTSFPIIPIISLSAFICREEEL